MLKGLAGVATHDHRQWVADLREYAGHPCAGPQVGRRLTDRGRPAEAWLPDSPARPVHLGPRRRRGPPPRRDFRVPVRSPGTPPANDPRLREAGCRSTRSTDGLHHRSRTRSGSIDDPAEIAAFLAPFGIQYESWEVEDRVDPNATAAEILAGYAPEIERLKRQGGYVTADVINVKPETPNLDAMLDRFSQEHTHSEDEVRFIVKGRGIFHIHPANHPVFAMEVDAGDLINVPAARSTGSTCAASRPSGPSASSRTTRAGRRITPTAISTPGMSRSAGDRATCLLRRARTRCQGCDSLRGPGHPARYRGNDVVGALCL